MMHLVKEMSIIFLHIISVVIFYLDENYLIITLSNSADLLALCFQS
jgi:hypothetical protein